MAIEIRHTKRAIVYRVVISSDGRDSAAISKTFRTKAAAEAWEHDILEARAAADRAPFRCPPAGTRPRSHALIATGARSPSARPPPSRARSSHPSAYRFSYP